MHINTNSKNQIIQHKVQSAGNQEGSSETIRKLSEQDKDWLAGILDGDGNFDIRLIAGKKTLRAIRITQHPRDARVLYRVKELLGGSIRVKGKKYLL